jgi:NAD(P)-dependent dehydrogenase (short-subunit alcohol dehydrogenase family)
MKSAELFDVKDLVVAITGAASGIGLAYAEVMAVNGARVALIDVDEKTLGEAVRGLNEGGADVHGEVADVTQPESLKRAFDSIVDRYGKLDVVFANAGISAGPGFLKGTGERNPTGEVENLSLEVWEKVFATNATSVFLTFQAVVPKMKLQGGGRIIVTSSISASMAETLVSSIYAQRDSRAHGPAVCPGACQVQHSGQRHCAGPGDHKYRWRSSQVGRSAQAL